MSNIKLVHSGGNSVSLTTPDSNPAANRTFKLPGADGTSGQAMVTNGSGALSFATHATYETGTYTPTFRSTGCTFSYNHQYGYWTKVGNIVHVDIYITLDSGGGTSGTTSNDIELVLPFSTPNLTRYEAAMCFSMVYKVNVNNSAGIGGFFGRAYQDTDHVDLLYYLDDSGGGAYQAGDFDQGSAGLAGSITYRYA